MHAALEACNPVLFRPAISDIKQIMHEDGQHELCKVNVCKAIVGIYHTWMNFVSKVNQWLDHVPQAW